MEVIWYSLSKIVSKNFGALQQTADSCAILATAKAIFTDDTVIPVTEISLITGAGTMATVKIMLATGTVKCEMNTCN